MPESFDGRAITRESSPKPPRTGGSQGATNASPAGSGTPGGGLDNMRAATQTIKAADTRATTSSLKRTGVAIDSFAGDRV